MSLEAAHASRGSAFATQALALLWACLAGAPDCKASTPNSELAQRVVITGTKPTRAPGWGPFQVYTVTTTNFTLGGWRSEDEMLDARAQCIAMGWKWPKSKDAIATALHDVRCNPATALSSAKGTTSMDLGELKWAAATAIYNNIRFIEPHKAGSSFEVIWADGGTSKYIVTGALGNVALSPMEASNNPGSGVAEPSPNCIKG